jgi:hypothetical protein
MSLEFHCTTCGILLRVPAESAGGQARCPTCASVMTIPALQASPGLQASPSPAPPPNHPFAAAPSAAPPEAGLPAPETAEGPNPYRSPSDYTAGWAAMSMAAPATAIQPARIDLGDIVTRTWEIFKQQWSTCLLGMIVAGAVMMVGYFALMMVAVLCGVGIQTQLGHESLIVVFVLFGYVAAFVFMLWIMAGFLQFLLAIARGQQPSLGLLFQGGPCWLRLLGVWLILWLIWVGAAIVCLSPAAAMLAVSEHAARITYGICSVINGVVQSVLLLMFSQAMFFVVDRQSRVLEALRLSREITRGNKWKLWVLWLAATLVTVVSMIPCGLGLLITMPYFGLMLPVVYLVMSGQPTANPRRYPYSPTPGFAG